MEIRNWRLETAFARRSRAVYLLLLAFGTPCLKPAQAQLGVGCFQRRYCFQIFPTRSVTRRCPIHALEPGENRVQGIAVHRYTAWMRICSWCCGVSSLRVPGQVLVQLVFTIVSWQFVTASLAPVQMAMALALTARCCPLHHVATWTHCFLRLVPWSGKPRCL